MLPERAKNLRFDAKDLEQFRNTQADRPVIQERLQPILFDGYGLEDLNWRRLRARNQLDRLSADFESAMSARLSPHRSVHGDDALAADLIQIEIRGHNYLCN